MNKPYFGVIIPAYNAQDTLTRAVNSVLQQTFDDYVITIVDDCSTDGTSSCARELTENDKVEAVTLAEKRWNGGARNMGIERQQDAYETKYTLFLDADDDYVDKNVFQELHDLLEVTEADMVRLPYFRHNTDGSVVDQTGRLLSEKTLRDVAHNCRVAAWTKCVKTDLLVPFPENTLMEDVCQHLKQVDRVNTFACMPRAVINWRIHSDSTSNSYSPKWKSSAYRFVADLMDLELDHDYCRERRDIKLNEALKNLREGRFEQ